MDNNNTNQNPDIDLNEVKGKVSGYIESFKDIIFDGVLYVQRNAVLVAGLFIIGAGIGFALDIESKQYAQKVFLTPNFGSVDYLYEQVERVQAKIKKKDQKFIKSVGIDPKLLEDIDIEPVVDIYDFMDNSSSTSSQSSAKVDIFKIMSENGELKNVLEDKTTSKNYRFHLLTIKTSKPVSRKEVVDPLLKLFGNNKYMFDVQAQYIKNLKNKMQENERIIAQIDDVVARFGSSPKNTSPNLLYFNENTDATEMLNLKNNLINENNSNKIRLIDCETILKENGFVENINTSEGVNGKMKFVIPVFFMFLLFCIVQFRNFYRAQTAKRAGVANA